jgi:glutathione peroxidase
VTFPITEKVDVNGQKRHPLFSELTAEPDAAGEAGDIQWNFEKFLISPAGEVVGRFRPTVAPDSEELVSALESVLPN